MTIRDMIAGIAAFDGVDLNSATDVQAVQWLIDSSIALQGKLAAAQCVIDNIRMQMANEDAPVRSAFRSSMDRVREIAAEQGHDVTEIVPR